MTQRTDSEAAAAHIYLQLVYFNAAAAVLIQPLRQVK
jgi:hypothetical protein